MNIKEIQNDIRECRKCPLYKYLDVDCLPVSGNGRSDANIMFIAEAPGENEELTGVPLVGLSGQLFDKMLLEAGIIRKECFIDNVVHCRPTIDNKGYKNRPPTDEEIKVCRGWIWEAIQSIDPKVIVTMGKVPTYTLLNKQLNKTFSILKIMGDEYKVEYHTAVVIPVVHPSFLLQRGKQYTQDVIEVFKKVREMIQPSDHDNWANTSPKDTVRDFLRKNQ